MEQRIQTIKSQLCHIPGLTQRLEQTGIHAQGQKTDHVLNEVIKRLQIREEELPFYQIRVQILDEAIQTLTPGGSKFL